MDPLPVDRATASAVDEILHRQNTLLRARVNAAAVYHSTSTLTITRAPLLWQAASSAAPDIILTINPHWWHALKRDAKCDQLLQALARVRPDDKANYLGRTPIVIARDA